jgi:hypothetical protein
LRMASRWTHKAKTKSKTKSTITAKTRSLSMIIGSHEADLSATDQRRATRLPARPLRVYNPHFHQQHAE